MTRARRAGVVAFASLLLALPPLICEAWEAPQNGQYTEKQLTAYLQCSGEFRKLYETAGKAAEGASGWSALAIAGKTNEQFQKILADHGLNYDEWSWIGQQTWEAFSAMTYQHMVQSMTKGIAESKKKNADQLEAARQTLATYEDAQKRGIRVLGKEELDRATARYREEADNLAGQLKQHTDIAAQAATEAQQAAAQAQQADDLAARPPADIAEEDRAAYIEQRKAEAESARSSAAELLESQKTALQSAADSKGRMDAALARSAHPEIPVDEEEKAQVQRDNEAQLAQAREQVQQCESVAKMLNEAADDQMKQINASKPTAPEQNVALLRQHLKEFAAALGVKETDLNLAE